MHSLDHWVYSNRLRHIHPGEKMLLAALLLAVSISFGSIWLGLVILALMALLTVRVASIPPRVLGAVCLAPLTFLVLSSVTLLLSIAPASSGMTGLTIGSYVIGTTPAALARTGELFGRALGGTSVLAFLTLTTPLDEMIGVLRRVGVPSYIAEVMTVMYRFIFVLAETASQVRLAQDARLGYSSLRRGYASVGTLAAMLFIHSYRRGQRLQMALEARGYDGELRMPDDLPALSKTRLVAILATALALGAIGLGLR